MKNKILVVDAARSLVIPFVVTDTLTLIQNSQSVPEVTNGYGTVILNDLVMREIHPKTARYILDSCKHTSNSIPFVHNIRFQFFLAGRLEKETLFFLLEEILTEIANSYQI